MSLTTIAKLKCEIKDTVREELLEELSDKKIDIEKECQELLNKTNKECTAKTDECNISCNKSKREAKEYCDKMMKVIDILETDYSEDVEFINIICFDKKEFIVRKTLLTDNSDWFKAFLSNNFKNNCIEGKYYLDCTGEIFNHIYEYIKSGNNNNVLPIDNKCLFNKITNQMIYYCIQPPSYHNNNDVIYDGSDIVNKYIFSLSNNGKIRAFWEKKFTRSRSKHYPGKIIDINKKYYVKFKANDGDIKTYEENECDAIFMYKPEFESNNKDKYVSGIHCNYNIITIREIRNKFSNFKFKLIDRNITTNDSKNKDTVIRSYFVNQNTNNIIYIDDF